MKANNHITIIRSFVAIGVACAISGAWAANVPAGTELAAKQELVRNNGSEPASLDPHKVESSVESSIISDFFEGLVEVRNDGSIEPRLAEKWEQKSSTVWVFHLRPGIKWSNGEPITAEDVVWSW